MTKKKLVVRIIFIIGFLICLYPLVSNIIEGYYQKDAVATYNKAVDSTGNLVLEESYKKGEEYNTVLCNQKSAITIKGGNSSILSDESYESILNMGNGVMGSMEIPKINVNLPIYHGTSDEVLSVGVGHVLGSSLPTGGINTRSVLSGHRGLPNAKLFTRLDEIVEGDLVFMRILGETLAYRVSDILIVEPEDVDSVGIVEGKDLLSLVTCTPYGLNTHRLIVTGERVPFDEIEYKNIKSKRISYREILFASIPLVFGGVVIIIRIKGKKKNKKKGGSD